MGANAREGLMGYVLAPVILSGAAEWMPHLLQIVLVCLIVVVMVKLALRFGADPVQAAFAGLLVVAIPPLLAMASTAMPDVLALALGLAGMEQLLAWKDERRWYHGVFAALALGLAPYARPHYVLLLALGAIWLFDAFNISKALSQLRRDARLWTQILAAAVILLAVNVLTGHRYSGAERNPEVGTSHLLLNLFAYLHYLSFPFPLAAAWFAVHRRKAKILLVVFSVPVIAVRFASSPCVSLVQQVELAAILFGGAVLVDLIWKCLANRDHVGSLLNLWLLIPLPLIVYAHLPIKYLLASMPAMVLIVIRLFSGAPRKRALLTYGTIVVVCAGYSVVLLKADYDFAEYGRRAAAELIAPRVGAGENVWYGGDWGFYLYAQEAGARVSRPDQAGPYPGELLAIGVMERGDLTLKRFPNRELVDSRSYDSPHGRTMGYGAGLYSNAYGFLSWRWNPKSTNVYQLWRVH
jgi:hypothetical protein